MLLREVQENIGLLRSLVRIRAYKIMYETNRWDGIPMSAMLECDISGKSEKYWMQCINIQDERRIASKNTTWVYAIIKLSTRDIEDNDKKHEEWKIAEELFTNNRHSKALRQFYDKYPPTHGSAYKDCEVVGWCTEPPDNEVCLLKNSCQCAVELGLDPAQCERCNGKWKHCDKMSDDDYLNRLDHKELIEIIKEQSGW